jgi:hypothetical protein
MARVPRTPRKPKWKDDIKQSADLKDIAAEIVGDKIGVLKDARIEYVMKTRVSLEDGKVAPPTLKDAASPGKASASSKIDQIIHKRQFMIQVNGNWWEAADFTQRYALMFHLLLHCWLREGKPVIQQHDFCGFKAEVEECGPWSKELKAFTDAMKQTRLPLDDETKPAGAEPKKKAAAAKVVGKGDAR